MRRRRRIRRVHMRRMVDVVGVFWRHGLGHALVRANMAECGDEGCTAGPLWSRWMPRVPPEGTWPLAVRDALVVLGPAFVKAGQILSVRNDLIPHELGEVLHSLQSDVPPLPFDQVRPVVEASLGEPIEAVFSEFEQAPLAAASIAQVHVGTLKDGTRVAVKVKRPGIEAVFERDLEILLWFACRLERIRRVKAYHPVQAVEELVMYTRRELDFRHEAEVATRLGAHFRQWDDVIIPGIHHASKDLLVMDYVAGFPIDDLAALDAHHIDRRALVRTTVNCVLEQILMLGLFHADPHPGNLHVTPEGRLVLLDFGIFGELDEDTRRDAGLSLLMLSVGHFELAGRYLLKLSSLEPQADPHAYRRHLARVHRAWRHSTVQEYGFARLVYEIVHLGAQYGVVYPAEVLLYVKAMATLEGVSLRVAPDMNLAEEAKPFLEELEARVHDRHRMSEALDHALPVWLEMAERIPYNAAAWLERQWEENGLHMFQARHRHRHARWPLGAVAAGVALLVAQVGPMWHGLSWLGMALLAIGVWKEQDED